MIHFITDFWRNWLMLFHPLPFGDPYLAWGALVVLYFPVRKFISSIF
ncbi:MAG TPA: hypothetical protein VFW37_05600 [Alphaproteobacteria bacterium]|nr:hypothetical protein [Alphaproteobacteria bacterium]